VAAVIRSMENKNGRSNPGAVLPVRGRVMDIAGTPIRV
jgi:hypothetical protein